MKFCKNVLGVTLKVTAHKKITAWHSLLGGHFELFLGSFWCMFLYFLKYILMVYFLLTFCIYVCSTTLAGTTLKNKFSHYFSFSVRGHFGVFWGPIWGIFEPFWRLSNEILYRWSWIILLQMVQNFWGFDMTHLRIW